MAEAATKLPVKTETKAADRPSAPEVWRPFGSLRREIDRLFDDFDRSFWRFPVARSLFDVEPFSRRELTWDAAPAVDISESERAFRITAELPGMDERNIEVKLAGGVLTIKGEKPEETEEKEKDYYLSERRYGSFQRSFQLPEGVDADKIEASFKKGVLTVTLPKMPEAQKKVQKIAVKVS